MVELHSKGAMCAFRCYLFCKYHPHHMVTCCPTPYIVSEYLYMKQTNKTATVVSFNGSNTIQAISNYLDGFTVLRPTDNPTHTCTCIGTYLFLALCTSLLQCLGGDDILLDLLPCIGSIVLHTHHQQTAQAKQHRYL